MDWVKNENKTAVQQTDNVFNRFLTLKIKEKKMLFLIFPFCSSSPSAFYLYFSADLKKIQFKQTSAFVVRHFNNPK